MPTLIAIDWDRREARVIAAAAQGRSLRIEHVFAVPWSGEGNDDAAIAARAATLKAALRERGLGRGDALVTIARGSVELKQLELPPAPDEELPDLVRFLARRELHVSDEAAPLDFVAAPVEEGKPRNVLVSAVEAKLIEQIRAVCAGAGLRLRRVLLRPCATASLAVRKFPDVGRALRLTVDLGGEEAEVVATAAHDVVLLRAARMPGDAASTDYGRALISELRRTLAAVQYQSGGKPVESITLCGARRELTATVESLAGELSLPVEVVDPGEQLEELGSPVAAPAELRRRLGPLLGALLDEAEEIAPAFDFANPRRRPAPPNQRKRIITGLAVAAAVVLVTTAVVWSRLKSLDAEIAAVRKQSTDLAPLVKEADALQKKAAEVEKWLKSDVVWLDELARLAKLFPPAKDAMLTQLRVAAHPQGGEMQLTGVLAESSIGDAVDTKLRDATHTVEGRGRRYDPAVRQYPWQFQSTVVVKTAAPPTAPQQGGR
jgi:Tfp pilus assembly PilM family ATPase